MVEKNLIITSIQEMKSALLVSWLKLYWFEALASRQQFLKIQLTCVAQSSIAINSPRLIDQWERNHHSIRILNLDQLWICMICIFPKSQCCVFSVYVQIIANFHCGLFLKKSEQYRYYILTAMAKWEPNEVFLTKLES